MLAVVDTWPKFGPAPNLSRRFNAAGRAAQTPSACPVTLYGATATVEPGNFSYSITGSTSNLDQIAHRDAGLATTPGSFPSGCTHTGTGVSSKDMVGVGLTTSGLAVMASAQYYTVTQKNQLFTLVIDSTGAMQSYDVVPMDSYPTALAAMDLNGDKNNDIIAGGSNSAQQAIVTVLPGNADGTFGTGTDYIVPGSAVVSLTVDDVNGDGKTDIIAVSGPSNQPINYSVLLGNGDGTFKAPVSYTTGPSSNPVQLGQIITAVLTSSGHKDLVSGNGTVFLGNGDGTFTQINQQAPFSYSNDIVSGDFNHDGNLDVAITAGDVISVFYGKGDGSFTAGPSYASVHNEGHLFAIDMDGDGNLDLMTGDGGNGLYGGDPLMPYAVYLLMGKPDGTFVGAQSLPFTNNGANFADLNGDGNLDAVGPIQPNLNTTPSFVTYLGTSSGIFALGSVLNLPSTGAHAVYAVNSYVVADFNGDGKPDLLFEPETASNYGWGAGFDFAPGNGDGSFGTLTFAGLPSFVPPGDTDTNPYITGLFTADFNHDGKADILYTFFDQSAKSGNYLQGYAVQLGNGDGTLKAPVITYTYNSPQIPASSSPLSSVAKIADINNDGIPDLFTITQTSSTMNQLQLYLGKGDGSFAAPVAISAADNPQGWGPVALGDLNGDGKLDLVSLGKSSTGGELAVSLGNGNGTFGVPTKLAIGSLGSASVAVADFNGDGKLDVALTGMNLPYAGVFLGNGDGTLQTIALSSTNTVAPGLSIPFVAGGISSVYDFNNDGVPDLVAGGTILLKGPSAAATTNASTIGLNASATSIQTGQNITLTATVSAPSGNSTVPTGTVSFADGANSLGTVALNASGVATLSTASLAAGSHSITATYSGDTNFAGSTSAAIAIVVQAPPPPSFGISLNPTSGTVSGSGTVISTLSLTPANGFSAAVRFVCSGLPADSTCSFSPSTVTSSGSVAATTLTITTGTSAAAVRNIPGIGAAAVTALAGLFAFWIPGRRRRLCLLGIIAGIMIALTGGCGGSKHATASTTTPAGTSQVIVTATSGQLTETATFTLTVQ